MKYILLYGVVIFLLLVSYGCKSPTAPESKLSSRNYSWTVDTLAYPGSFQTVMYTIWGAKSNNMWVAGHNDRGWGRMYHYDGNIWTPIDLSNVPSSVYYSFLGLSADNIYLAGEAFYMSSDGKMSDSSIVLHYDGSRWSTSLLNQGRMLFSTTGSSNDIYTAGYDRTLFHYDGSKWIKEDLNFYIPSGYENFATSILKRKDSSVLMLYQGSQGANTIYYFLEYKNSSWIKIDSFSNVSGRFKWGSKLWESLGGTTYSVNPLFFKLNATQWQQVLSDNNLYTAVGGTEDNNVFIAGQAVMQFNGSDWYEFKDISFKYGIAESIYCFSNEVFILFSDGNKSYVIMGKLKN